MSWGVSASHVPVLTLIPKLFKVQRVLEIGSGELSTKLFIDKIIYPDLKKLVTVEEDPEWMTKTREMVGQDARVTILSSVPANLYGYDLIFVDGPQLACKRSKTIRFVMWQPNRTLLSSLIVVHDIEHKPYRGQVNPKYHKYYFSFCKAPMTGIFSSAPLPVKRLTKANRVMRSKFDELQENWGGWKGIL